MDKVVIACNLHDMKTLPETDERVFIITANNKLLFARFDRGLFWVFGQSSLSIEEIQYWTEELSVVTISK